MSDAANAASGIVFWRDDALPFIEARSVRDGRAVCYARHWHETFSIGLICRGRCNYTNRRSTTVAGHGTVVLMNPGDVHACNPVRGEPWSYRMLYMNVPWLCDARMGPTSNRSHGFAPFATISSTLPELYRGLNRLFDTLIDPGIEALEKEAASICFVESIHHCLGPTRSPLPAAAPRLTRAAEFIRENCTRSLSLREICEQASLSASHLIRAFKAAYGLTPHAYQLNCRIEFCRSRLRRGQSLSDVALAAGFADQAHFQRIFKRFVAATPRQYQIRAT